MTKKIKAFILVCTAGSSLVSCTPSPEWIKSQRDKVTVTLVEPTTNEIKRGNVNGFTLLMAVTADSMSLGGALPSQTSGGNLGAKFQINRPGIRYGHTSFNVDDCVDKAAEQGVINFFSTDMPDSRYQYQTIAAFLDRFTDCIKEFGYSIEKL